MIESQTNANKIPAGPNEGNDEISQTTDVNAREANHDDNHAKTTWRTFFTRQRAQASTINQQQRRPIQLSARNQRSNTNWGDTLGPKATGTIRVYAQNLNGLTLNRKGGTFDELCRVQKELNIDIFCGQEHNLDTSQASVRNQLYTTTRQHWDRSRLITGTTPINFTHQYKPGGTLMLAAGDISSRISRQDSDKWGRWVTQEIQGRQATKLVIISAYQVIYKAGQLGLITAATQQVSLLTRSQDILRNPRDAFIRDLSAEIQSYMQDNVEILLIGDFNETVGSNPNGITSIIAK